jgi:hypothetical protein
VTPKPQGCPGTLTAVVSNQVGMSLEVLDGTSVIGTVGPRSIGRFVVLHSGSVRVRQAGHQYSGDGQQSIKYHLRYECAR